MEMMCRRAFRTLPSKPRKNKEKEKDKEKPKPSGNTSNAAKSILEQYMRRPRG